MQHQHRHLAAILFTDIVGYTSMMQQNELQAVAVIKHYNDALKKVVAAFKGKILNSYGDGSLCTFHSATEAVQCAMALQQQLQSEPIVPLRIGLHIGEIFFEEGKVLGDGVNIASRIQSLGQANTILLSAEINDKIKNHPEFKSVSLGLFAFRNVDKPMEVFALANEGLKVLKPEEMEGKLKPETKIKKPTSYRKWLIPACIGVLFLTLGFFSYRQFFNQTSDIGKDKSIAVLPFRNDSKQEETEHFANGVMEQILNNLAKITELSVLGRTSVEQFRGRAMTLGQINEILKVSYLLEGSVQKFEDKVVVNVQLLETRTGVHVWSDSYEYSYKSQFKIMKEIAQEVARKIRVKVTPQEDKLMNQVPTNSLTAYDLFLRAREEHYDYWLKKDTNALNRAEVLYKRALQIDSTFAQAYTGLALTYWDKYYGKTYFEKNFMDSALYLANVALSYNDQLDEAYLVRGSYYTHTDGDFTKSISEYDKAVRINPNNSLVQFWRGWLFFQVGDFVNSLEAHHKAATLDRGKNLPNSFRALAFVYNNIGHSKTAESYLNEALKLDNDSAAHFLELGLGFGDLSNTNNNEQTLTWYRKAYQIDSLNPEIIFRLAEIYARVERFEESYKHWKEYFDLTNRLGWVDISKSHRMGYALFKLGREKEADYYFHQEIREDKESIRLKRFWAALFLPHYDVAAVYAFKGQKEMAYKYLRQFNQRKSYPLWMVNMIKIDPLFDSMRGDKEFQQIVRNVEEKYEREKERANTWLKEQDLL
jgi:TolB-like protein/class 3 adenylate cyclase/predicted Zn-dependent protease